MIKFRFHVCGGFAMLLIKYQYSTSLYLCVKGQSSKLGLISSSTARVILRQVLNFVIFVAVEPTQR